MGRYLIERTDQGRGYVAKPGRKSSYTNDVKHARKYDSRENAEADCCKENEIVVDIETAID